jgi:hypothetical protein
MGEEHAQIGDVVCHSGHMHNGASVDARLRRVGPLRQQCLEHGLALVQQRPFQKGDVLVAARPQVGALGQTMDALGIVVRDRIGQFGDAGVRENLVDIDLIHQQILLGAARTGHACQHDKQ